MQDINDLDTVLIRELPVLKRFAMALTRERYAADDLVQDTLEKAILAWPSRRRQEAARAWLCSILYRHFLDGQRRSGRLRKLLQRFSSAEPETVTLEQQLQDQQALGEFARLPEAQRSILMLISVEGMSYEEVSDVLGVPLGTVMSRLSRARQAYRQLLAEQPPAAAPASLRVVK